MPKPNLVMETWHGLVCMREKLPKEMGKSASDISGN
jgi:hypothetical protein